MPNADDSLLWGATLNAHAVEGRDFDSDWWRFEQRPGRIAGGATSEVAADHLNRARDDIALAHKLGLSVLQYSLSWARVAPAPDRIDENALAHYRDVFQAMARLGVTPVAVLQEQSLPAWFADAGAWANPAAGDWFQGYLERVFETLSPHCRHWVPLHDPALWRRMVYGDCRWPRPAGARRFSRRAAARLRAVHLRARDYLREQDSAHQLGISIAAPALEPLDPHSPWDLRATRWQHWAREREYADALAADVGGQTPFDFIALSLPGRRAVFASPTRPASRFARYAYPDGRAAFPDEGLPAPEALPAALERAGRWNVPILVTCGIATEDDAERCAFIADHATAVLEARAKGHRILGYCHRSLLDGFEGCHGYRRRYGLVHVDRNTLARTPNPSAFLLNDIAKHGALRPGAIARYCPGWSAPEREAS